MIIDVTAADIMKALPGRTDPLELAAKRQGLKLSAGRDRILVDHGPELQAQAFTPPPWWSLLWTRFHASGQLEWTPGGWANAGKPAHPIAAYLLEVPEAALAKVPRKAWQPAGRCRGCGKANHPRGVECPRARSAA